MRLIRGYWKSIVVCIGILYVSLVRTPEVGIYTFSGADKLVHMLMYIFLAAMLTWESLTKKANSLRLWLTAILFPIFYGLAIELIQHFCLSYRTGDIWDVVANSVGVLVGFRLVIVISSKL